MSDTPATHISDALKLQADGKVHFYEVNSLGGATVYIKPDNDWTWRGDDYYGLPISLSGEKQATEGTPTPKLTIGQQDLDLLPFKALIHGGNLDGAQIIRRKVLLDHVLSDSAISEDTYFRVKRIDSYSRSTITLTLATFSSAIGQTIPFREYVTPDFPWVTI